MHGPYTRFYINHINPWAKILSYMSKNNMMRLQYIALVGQISVLLDKSWRPKISQENWWSIRYYSIFAAINIRAILAIMREQRPVYLSGNDLELYELLFRPNHFSARQFQTLISKAQWHEAYDSALVTEGQHVDHLLLLASGECDVTIGGDQANVIRPGDFIGELEYMQAQDKSEGSQRIQAPVSVIAKGKVQYVSWSFEELAALLNSPSNKQILVRMEALLAKDIATKLLETDIRHAARLTPDNLPGVPPVT